MHLQRQEIDSIMATYDEEYAPTLIDRMATRDADEAERDQLAACEEDGCRWPRCGERAWSDAYATAHSHYSSLAPSEVLRLHDARNLE